jgi:hypothetical protein
MAQEQENPQGVPPSAPVNTENNGHGNTASLQNTAQVAPAVTSPGNVNVAKDQKTPGFLSGNQLSGMTSTKEMESALNYLVHPGKTARDMTMRTVIFSKRTEGSRMATIYAFHLGRCRYFHDIDGEEEILDMFALNVSVDGKSRDQLTTAIIGKEQHEERKGGLGQWLKNTSGMGDK